MSCFFRLPFSILGAELLKGLANELWTIFRNDGMEHLKSTYVVLLHKLYELDRLDPCISLGFYLLGEIICGYQNKIPLSCSQG